MVLKQIVKKYPEEWGFWVKPGNNVWFCICPFNEKHIPKAAGFTWHPDKKTWWTGDRDKAAKLAEYAEAELRNDLMGRKAHMEASLVGSRQSASFKEFPHPEGLDYFPFQKAGIEYLSSRPNTLLADDMGLGKTIQVIGLINTDPSIKTVLVVCPATLKLNWRREMERWLVRDMGKIGVSDSKLCLYPSNGFNITITNYEAMRELNQHLSSVAWDLLVVDEAHYLKNAKTLRYQSLNGGERKDGRVFKPVQAKRIVYTTGTPICNRPAELWPLISAVDPDRWNKTTFWYYHKRYCNVQNTRFGMDFKGAATEDKLSELQTKLRETIMIRRLKSEVLTELPPKIRQVVELEYEPDDDAVRAALDFERQYDQMDRDELVKAQAEAELAKASDNDEEYKEAIQRLVQCGKVLFSDMAKVRHDTAVAKIPYAIDYLKEQLETTNKVIVFAHHHEVLKAVHAAFPLESILIYGETKMEDRQMLVDRFQGDPNIRVAVVSIMAGGVGITLTAASTVYFLELDWVPGNVTQAEDRAHRIGQHDVVTVQHLVLRESLDVKMAKTIIAKQKIIEAALDKIVETEPVVPSREEAATKTSSRKKITEEAETITPEVAEAVLTALKVLAGSDEDYARAINGVGFSKIDVMIGHSLAARCVLSPKQAALGKRIVRKYKKQIPAELYAEIFEERVGECA